MKKFVPLAIFIGLAALLGVGLTLKPAEVPSARIDKPVPNFTLPAVEGLSQPGFATADLKGKIVFLNVFASWCGPCIIEAPQIEVLGSADRIALIGLNYKDKPEAARAFLQQYGNPYKAIGADLDGRAAIDLGVSGAPETYVIDKKGVIRHQHIGPVMASDIPKLLEIARKLEQEP